MKPRERKPETVYRIVDRATGEAVGSYSRAYCDEYDFESPESARSANFHGIFKNGDKYAIAKYRVTYELIDPDCDPGEPTPPRTPTDDLWDNFARIFSERVIEEWNKP